jgi:succinoglycan biosynthesis transport protein ExoP
MADQRLTGESTESETDRLRSELAAAEAAELHHAERVSTQRRSSDRPGLNAIPFPAGNEPPSQPAGPAAGYGYSSNVLGDADVHLIDYVKVLYKRRWTAITAFLVVFLSVAIYTFTATPIYESKVQILIEKEATNVVSFKEAIEQNQIADDYYQTQYKILQSRALARKTIDATHLWDHPQFNPKSEPLTVGRIVGAPVALVFGWLKSPKPPAVPGADETKTQSRTIDRFLTNLSVSPIRNSRLVDVTFESPNAALSSQIANALATAYIAQNLEFKFMSSKEASDWLGERLGEQKKQVETSEQALQKYREQTDSVSLEDKQNIVVQKLADLNGAVTRAKTERIQKEALYEQVHSLQGDRAALDTFPAILTNTFIQQQKGELADLQRQQAQLSDKLGPHHPDMMKIGLAIQTAEAKIQTEISKVIQSTRNEYQAARAQEQSLMNALEQQKRDALALNRKGIDYGVLQRDATSNRQIFDSLMQRTKETGISGELKTSNIRVIDAAETPRRPARPNARNNLLIALFGGTTLALVLTFFFEYLDDRIKTPEEIKAHLGLSFIGLVPALFEKDLHDPLMSNAVPANFAEAFRAIRSNVLFSSADEGSKVLVVTSSAPGEGKTLVASNLAVALAQANQRVLIVDADMRKPRVHGVFQQTQEPGLSNVLVGNAKASEAVRNTKVAGLWAMPAGVLPPNPSELLGSKRFKEFVGTLGQHFDWVIIDSPPIMAVTDSSIVAHVATGVVFVIGSDMTSRHTAQRSLEQLQNANAKVIGAILNRVDLKHHAYYYSQYYKKAYADYYHSSNSSAA